MTTSVRGHPVPLGAEIALAFLAGAGAFALLAVVLSGIESDAVVVLVAVPFVVAVVAVALRLGVAYAVPIAMAGMLAFDWYYLPPTHPLEFPDTANAVDLLVYLSVAVLIGELAAHAARRSAVSEEARGAIAGEQAALRRVATRVAQGTPARELLSAVAEEAGMLLAVDGTRIDRYQDEDEIVHTAQWTKPGYDPPSPDRAGLEGTSVSAEVLRTGRVGRIDNCEDIDAGLAHGPAVKSVVGAPIVVEGRRWGVIVAWSTTGPLPGDAEARLMDFSELVAAAIANTETRAEVHRLADEQAALRRVATLVAQDVPPSELFAAVAEEVGTLLDADLSGMIRFEADDTVTPVATWAALGEHPDVPDRWPTEEGDAASMIATTGAPARIDNWSDVPGPLAVFARDELGIKSSVGSPIFVEGRLWGALAVHSRQAGPLPANTESRLRHFTELVGTAVANAQTRGEVQRLADEQAALRRVATLIARQSAPAEVFAAVAEEVGRLLPVQDTAMFRYEEDGTAKVVASWGQRGEKLEVGSRMTLGGENVTTLVHRTRRSGRIDNYSEATGAIGQRVRKLGTFSAVGCPIVVNGRLWGVMVAAQDVADPLPAATESRVAQFTELIATGISSVQARSDLAASRARIVAATDETRRRFERDLHDGVQQRLVSLGLELRNAEAETRPDDELHERLARIGDGLTGVLDDLRELSRGIHPAVLSTGGLGPALKALARRSAVPVRLQVGVDQRFDEQVEVTAYYVVSEALANVAKHAGASETEVHVEAHNGILDLRVQDDGIGGADPARGSGLVGLADRVEAMGGAIAIESPSGAGTAVHVELPVKPANPASH